MKIIKVHCSVSISNFHALPPKKTNKIVEGDKLRKLFSNKNAYFFIFFSLLDSIRCGYQWFPLVLRFGPYFFFHRGFALLKMTA